MYISNSKLYATIFEDLACGDVFTSNGSYYMKINNPNDNNNAVNLFDGDICHFGEAQIIYIIDYEFTIK